MIRASPLGQHPQHRMAGRAPGPAAASPRSSRALAATAPICGGEPVQHARRRLLPGHGAQQLGESAPAGSRPATGGAAAPRRRAATAAPEARTSAISIEGLQRRQAAAGRRLEQPQLGQYRVGGQVAPPDVVTGRACQQRLGHLRWLAGQPGRSGRAERPGSGRRIAVSSGSGVPGSRRAPPVLFELGFGEHQPPRPLPTRAPPAPSLAWPPPGPRRPGRARPPRPRPVSRTGTAASPRARCVTARPASRSSSRSTRAGAGSRQARSSRSSSRWSASVPSGWARATPRTHVGELRPSSPAGRAEQPSGDRVRLGGGQLPAEQAGRRRDGREPVVEASSVPDANAIACCHSPGAAITPVPASSAASGWTPPPGVCPAADRTAGSSSRRRAAASRAGSRSGGTGSNRAGGCRW